MRNTRTGETSHADCGSCAQRAIALPVLPFMSAVATRFNAASKNCYLRFDHITVGSRLWFFFFASWRRVLLRFTVRVLCAMLFALHAVNGPPRKYSKQTSWRKTAFARRFACLLTKKIGHWDQCSFTGFTIGQRFSPEYDRSWLTRQWQRIPTF